MKSLLCFLLLTLPQAPVQEEADSYAFVDVHVLTMEDDEVLASSTVVVRDGRIVSIAPLHEARLEPNTVAIAGEGRWLLPGLADSHVHTWDPNELTLFLANGVTSIRNLFGSPTHVGWRDEIESGARLGPRIRTAGPIVDGDPPVWPGSAVVLDLEDADRVVGEQLAAGYDFVKVYARLSPEAYEAVVQVAGEAGLPVEGHVPSAVGIERVLESGQRTIEHLDGYDALLEAEDSPGRGKTDFLSRSIAWNHVDPEHLPVVAERARRSGVWNCPTVVVMQKWKGPEEAEDELAADYMRYISPFMRASWTGMASGRTFRSSEIRAGTDNRLRFVRALHEAGARLLVGTDAGNPWVPAGFSLHDELANFVAAGIPAHATLRIATRDAAEFAGLAGELGTVSVGKHADLLLVDEDPRETLATLRRPHGVMTHGRWLDRARLDAMLADIAARHAPKEER